MNDTYRMTSDEYVACAGTKCPYFKSSGILLFADVPENDGTMCYAKVRCDDCGQEWIEIYRLSGYEETE